MISTESPRHLSPVGGGTRLDPPGEEGAFIAASPAAAGRTASLGFRGPVTDGLPAVALAGPHGDPGAADLVILDAAAVEGITASGGARAVRSRIDELRRRTGGLVAAPAHPDGPFDGRGADVVLCEAHADPGQAAQVALAAGVRAAGRPVLVDARDPGLGAESLLAARDVGAAGAIVRTGDASRDEQLVSELLELERARLERAPPASVVICVLNAADHLERCLTSLERVDYPRFETVVVDDGSTDASADVARRHGVKVIGLEHSGTSFARNTGMRAAAGEVIAFLDADAAAPTQWLADSWRLMDRLGAEGCGGPNLPFPEAGLQELAVSGAPGVPLPVADPDGFAVHLPSCNFVVTREAMERVGGFDDRYSPVYEDVDLCLRLIESGARLYLHPGAYVLHHRRDSARGFLRQQAIYAAVPQSDAEGRDLMGSSRRSFLGRLDPRGRYVFVGPQARQLYTLRGQPLNFGLPFKLLGGLAGITLAGAPLAWAAGALVPWLIGCAAAITGFIAWMIARVPVFRPAGRRPGVAQRLLTAGLWLAQPAAWRLGQRRFRRERSADAP